MTKQEYKDKNNDLQKYIGYNRHGEEIISIFLNTDDSINTTTTNNSERLTGAWSVNKEVFLEGLDFPKLFIETDTKEDDEYLGLINILNHHGYIQISGGLRVSFQQMKDQAIKLLSKKEEVKENQEIKKGDAVMYDTDPWG